MEVRVWKNVMYLRTGGRRPVAIRGYLQGTDVQAMPPLWWCERCGGEVYRQDAALCWRCIKCEEDEDGTEETHQPL